MHFIFLTLILSSNWLKNSLIENNFFYFFYILFYFILFKKKKIKLKFNKYIFPSTRADISTEMIYNSKIVRNLFIKFIKVLFIYFY